MASSSSVGRSEARVPAAASSEIPAWRRPIPDPRTWPAEIRNWYHHAVGDYGPLEVFLFNFGETARFFLQDAITAMGLIGASESEWHIEFGYPVFVFDVAKIEEFTRRLSLAGYIVRELVPVKPQKPINGRRRKAAQVIDIETVRNNAKRAETE